MEDTSSDLWSILPREFTVDTLRPLLPTINIEPEDDDNLNAISGFLESLHSDGAVQVEDEDNPKPLPTRMKMNVSELKKNVAVKAQFTEGLKKEGLLPSAMLELTYRCNEKCVHCFNPRQQCDAPDNLTTQEVIKLIDELHEIGIYNTAFSGGEASLRNDIFEILDECRRLNLAFQIFTNGLIPEEKVQRLISYYPQQVSVSIYSANPDIHDATTQVKGSWKKSIQTIKTLVTSGIRVVMKCPLMQHTIHGYKEFIDGLNEPFKSRITDALEKLQQEPPEGDIKSFSFSDRLLTDMNKPPEVIVGIFVNRTVLVVLQNSFIRFPISHLRDVSIFLDKDRINEFFE